MNILETFQRKVPEYDTILIFQLAQIYHSVLHINLRNVTNLEGKGKSLGAVVFSIASFQSRMINIPIFDRLDISIRYLIQKRRERYFCSYLLIHLNFPQFNCILVQHVSFLLLFLEPTKIPVIFLLISFRWYLKPQEGFSFPSFGRLSLFGKDYTQEHILMELKETANCLFFLHQENKRQPVQSVCPPSLELRVGGYSPNGRWSLRCLPEDLLAVSMNSYGTGGSQSITPYLLVYQSSSYLK